eukprot:scaffold1113_cov379-Prasinococcus_capsulatus_cf.AAC.11
MVVVSRAPARSARRGSVSSPIVAPPSARCRMGPVGTLPFRPARRVRSAWVLEEAARAAHEGSGSPALAARWPRRSAVGRRVSGFCPDAQAWPAGPILLAT